MNRSKLLVIGSCGFIMGNFIRKAVYEKFPYSIVSLDRVNNDNLNSIYLNKSHIFHIADILDKHVLNTIFQFEQPDFVIHGAVDYGENCLSNILGTQNVIEACLRNKVSKLLYLSTDEVYGELSDEKTFWDESSPVNPINTFSVSKLSGELLIQAAGKSDGLIYNIARLSNNYGIRQSIDYLIPKTIKSILENQKIIIYNQGKLLRDWMHVGDTSSALLSVLENGKSGEIYNISVNQECSNLEMAQKICNIMKNGHQLIDFSESKSVFRRAMNSQKLRDLGWKPAFSLKNDLNDCVQWYLNNKWHLKMSNNL